MTPWLGRTWGFLGGKRIGPSRYHRRRCGAPRDIDEPISDHGGAVHAYVGDEVIVTWPITGDPARNAWCLACFFAIERKMARLAADYDREFDVVPHFRAGLHAGPVIVSEAGGAKRQLAYFGDTMNVAARLCEYCKVVNQRLVVSGDLLRQVTIPLESAGWRWRENYAARTAGADRSAFDPAACCRLRAYNLGAAPLPVRLPVER